MATSGYLDSIKITGGDSAAGTRKTRYLRFSWSVTGTEIGKTTIAWELKGYGGNNAYTDYGIQLNGEWVVPKTYNATVSYKETVITSGTKTYTHNASGAATVSVSIWVGQIWDVSEGTTSKDWSLETNYPYTSCTAPSIKSITPAIQKPGGKITISWEGGSGGKANPITSYNVQYKIGSGSWSSAQSTTSTSKDITLPTNATRGATITARVMSVGTVSGYDSSYSSAGGSGRVNNLPGAPTVKSIDKTLIPSTGATVNFELTAGGVGTGDTGQTGSLYYATSSTGTKSVCNANFSPTVGATTTYYFWTYDGLEYSSSYASQKITVNTKPTVSLSISGTKANNETATFTKGSNGQSTGNTYTFGFTYNNKDYTLASAQTATSYSIGDMRKRLSDKLNSLTDNTTYSYKFWVYRNDGIEDSDKAISSNTTLSIPKFTLLNDKGVAASFSKKVTVSLSGASNGSYSTAALGTETPNGMILNTAGLNWGEKIEKILINGSFYVTPQTTLTKVHAIDMIASAGMTSPYTPNPFCTYTSQTLGISLASRLGAAYGVDSVPNLTVTSSKGKIEDIQGSGNDSTWTYSISGSQLYKLINSSAATLSLVFSIKNKFDDVFTKTFVLNLDNTAAAVTYFAKPIDLYPGTLDGKTSSPKYPSLNQWIYLKEKMPFWLDFSVLAFDQPTFQFELGKNWQRI